jgi:hypothetical protein
VPTAAYGGLQKDGEHWITPSDLQTYVWSEAGLSWGAKQRVFVGEAAAGGASISSVTTYALNGRYAQNVVEAGTITSKNHNIGFVPRVVDFNTVVGLYNDNVNLSRLWIITNTNLSQYRLNLSRGW